MRLVQFLDTSNTRRVAVSDGATLQVLSGVHSGVHSDVRSGVHSVYDLAQTAIATGGTLLDVVTDELEQAVNYDETLQMLEQAQRLLLPLDHPDPHHCFATGTGLTHLGSADTRNSMHAQTPNKNIADENLSDSMKMFQMGLSGGKPAAGATGVQPEWFYKGNGHALRASGQVLESPDFALDGGEEPEIVGLYVNAPDGTPYRVGFALGNEFSDHVTEKQNYLYLAHSKLRPCALGPELLLGDLPKDVQGTSRIIRDNKVIWEKPFLSGEANMSHSVANLEHHHFKYPLFRQAGDVHVHFFGTATLSFADGITPQAGDVFEIDAPLFGQPLRNTLEHTPPRIRHRAPSIKPVNAANREAV